MSLKQIEADRKATLARAKGLLDRGDITPATYAARVQAIHAAHDRFREQLLRDRAYNAWKRDSRAEAREARRAV